MKLKILELLTDRRKTGNLGEDAAAAFLRKKGYRIRKRNYAPLGREIDIIAEDKTTVVFVEVKTRTLGHESEKEPRPASAVTPDKQRGIISAAKYYAAFSETTKRLRFDVIEVYLTDAKPRPKVERIVHMEGAFNADTARRRTHR